MKYEDGLLQLRCQAIVCMNRNGGHIKHFINLPRSMLRMKETEMSFGDEILT